MNPNIIFAIIIALVVIIMIIIIVMNTEPTIIHLRIGQMAPDINIPDDRAQNVHDTNVRRTLWQKYYHMKEDIKKRHESEGVKWLDNIITRVKKEVPQLGIDKINKLLEEIYKANSITALEFTENELEVFALVWDEYTYRKLPMTIMRDQLLDCYDSEGHLVCLTGRISRYIGVFEGLTDDYLGQSEQTVDIIFNEAVKEGKKILDDYLEKTPEMKKIYLEGGTMEEEQKLEEFLSIIKPRARNRLAHLYPIISHKIPEIIEGF